MAKPPPEAPSPTTETQVAPPPDQPTRRLDRALIAGLLFLVVAIAVLLAVLLTGRGNQTGRTTPVAANTRTTKSSPATTTVATTTTAATTAATTTTAQATVPSLSGSLQSALRRLRDAGFQASVAYVPSSQPFGTVVAQSPAGGATAPTNSHVTVNVSSGHAAASEQTVPNTVGMTIPAAVAAVNSAGLRLVMLKRTVTDQSQAGKVVAQTPAAGAHAPKNSKVLVYMGAYKGA